MDWVLASIRVVFGVAGLMFAVLLLNVSLISVQAMTGRETFGWTLAGFAATFALAFAVGAGSLRALAGRGALWPTVRAFAIGGSIGGALEATTLTAVARFEPQLRVLTDGGPIGHFLLAGTVAAIGIAALVGTVLLRRTRARG